MISDGQANAANLACSAIACLVLLARLIITRYQSKTFDLSWFVAAVAFVCLLSRAIISFEVIRLGTAGDAIAKLKKNPKLQFTEQELSNIRAGSVLVLVTRLFLTTALWCTNVLLLLLYRRFVQHLPWMKHAINACWLLIATSYAAVILATFFECHPFALYWEVGLHTSSCVKAYVQTVLQCSANMLIDVVIMIISIPILFIKGSNLAQRLRIGGLISLGVFCILTNVLRLYYIFAQGSNQATRTFWASLSIGVATIVANAPVLYGSVTIHKRKRRTRYGYPNSWHYSSNNGSARRLSAPVVLYPQPTLHELPASSLGPGGSSDRKDVITKQTVVAVHSESTGKLSRMGIDDSARPAKGYTAAATAAVPPPGRPSSKLRHYDV